MENNYDQKTMGDFIGYLSKRKYDHAREILKQENNVDWSSVLLLMHEYRFNYYYPEDIIIGVIKSVKNIQELLYKIIVEKYLCIDLLIPYIDPVSFVKFTDNSFETPHILYNIITKSSRNNANFYVSVSRISEMFRKLLNFVINIAMTEEINELEEYLSRYPKPHPNPKRKIKLMELLEIIIFLIEEGSIFDNLEERRREQLLKIYDMYKSIAISTVFIKKGMYNKEFYDTNALKLLKTYL